MQKNRFSMDRSRFCFRRASYGKGNRLCRRLYRYGLLFGNVCGTKCDRKYADKRGKQPHKISCGHAGRKNGDAVRGLSGISDAIGRCSGRNRASVRLKPNGQFGCKRWFRSGGVRTKSKQTDERLFLQSGYDVKL